jgi:uncharacterized protein (TIRG00374 family)
MRTCSAPPTQCWSRAAWSSERRPHVKRSWLFLLFVSLAASLAIPVLYGGLDSLQALRRVSPWAVLSLLGLVLAGWGFNAARVRLLVRSLKGRLSRRRAMAVVVAAEFAGVATPASAGNPATYVYLLSRQEMNVSHAAAVVAIDQLTDLIFFGTAMPVAILLFALDGGISHPLRIAALMLALLIAGLLLLVMLMRHYRAIALLSGRFLQRLPRMRRLRFRLGRGVVNFRRSVQLLLGMGLARLTLLYLYCLGHWMIRYGILPLILWYLGSDVPWGYLFVLQGVLLFISQITFLPGGGGGVEVGFAALLAPYLDASTTATALLLWRFCTFYWYLLAGAPVFALTSGQMAARLVARSP